jgi:hypothetical protein
VQTWIKPQPNGATAVLFINSNLTSATNVRLELSKLNMSGVVKVRDVWAHTENGTVQGVLEATVPAVDSVFLLLTAVPSLLVPARSDGEGRA